MLVLLGWLLALATSPIVEAIKRRREIKETKAAILAELAELKYRMAIIACWRALNIDHPRALNIDQGMERRRILCACG